MRSAKVVVLAAILVVQAAGLAVRPAAALPTALTEPGYVGDFNGDGRTDVANFDGSNGTWDVGLSSGTRFRFTQWGDYADANATWIHRIGDFNGDGMDDVFSFKDGNGRMIVGLSTGTSFTVKTWREASFVTNWATFIPADYDGDGDEDIVGFHTVKRIWYLYRSSGTSFEPAEAWSGDMGDATATHIGGDFNGDRRPDVASFRHNDATWRVSTNTGASFNVKAWADLNPDDGWLKQRSGDFNGDGRTDIANFFTGGELRVSVSQADDTFSTTQWADLTPNNGWGAMLRGRFNNDAKDDLALFLPEGGKWIVNIASGPTSFTSSLWVDLERDAGWGSHGTGDFNGDGLSDIASFHQPSGQWWVSQSTGNSFTATNWTPINFLPHASFTHDCTGFNCVFHDTSTDNDGSIVSRTWDFGDGTTATERDVNHSYDQAGDYVVTLTVTDDAGDSDTETKTIQVREMNTFPDASFTYSCDILKCKFKDTSTDDGEIVTSTWDFGDGKTAEGTIVTHTYSAGGSKTVRHKVTDAAGQSDEEVRQIEVVRPHKRVVEMSLEHIQGFLYAKGRVRVPGGFDACRGGRDVTVQKKQRDGDWVKVVKGRTNSRGRYLIPLYYYKAPHDRPGTYRVKAPQEEPATRPGHVCLQAVADKRTHVH